MFETFKYFYDFLFLILIIISIYSNSAINDTDLDYILVGQSQFQSYKLCEKESIISIYNKKTENLTFRGQ